jgi:hypothetical protein
MSHQTALLIAFLALAQSGDAGVVRVDFRGKTLDERYFVKVVGRTVKDDPRIKVDDGGLRVTLPAGQATPLGEYGVQAKFRIKGDFEITASYELLAAEPDRSSAVGVTIYLRSDHPAEHSMMLGRYNARGGASYYQATRGKTVNGRRQLTSTDSLAGTPTGKLRIVRQGSQVAALAADAGSEMFTEVDRIPDFSIEDVIFFRLAGQKNGRNDVVFDARIPEVEMRSAETFASAATPPAADGTLLSGPPAKSAVTGGWLVAAELSVLVVLVLLLALWRRRKRNPVQPVK